MSSIRYIPSAVARSLLPTFRFAEVDALLNARGDYDEATKRILYAHYLVARGDFNGLVDYLSEFDPVQAAAIVNDSVYETYFGNTLNTCAYWNTGHEALALYRLLTAMGARAYRDYYGDLPWTVNGGSYVCPLRGVNVSPGYERDPHEFEITHSEIKALFSIPDPVLVIPAMTPGWSSEYADSTDPIVLACPRHCPGAPYNIRECEYYGTAIPDCNGCSRGAFDRY